jgi:hypothetical protein
MLVSPMSGGDQTSFQQQSTLNTILDSEGINPEPASEQTAISDEAQAQTLDAAITSQMNQAASAYRYITSDTCYWATSSACQEAITEYNNYGTTANLNELALAAVTAVQLSNDASKIYASTSSAWQSYGPYKTGKAFLENVDVTTADSDSIASSILDVVQFDTDVGVLQNDILAACEDICEA